MRDVTVRIREFRVARGWSQDELARRCEVSRNSVQNWERGQGLRIGYLVRVADVFGVTLDDLVGRIPPPAVTPPSPPGGSPVRDLVEDMEEAARVVPGFDGPPGPGRVPRTGQRYRASGPPPGGRSSR